MDIYIKRDNLKEKIEAVQADTGRYILFSIRDFSIPENATARFFAKKPSGLEIYNMAEITGNSIKVNLTSQTLAEPGIVLGELQLVNGEKLISSFVFPIEVKKSIANATAIESTNEYGVLDSLLNEAREKLEEIIAGWESLKEEIQEATRQAKDVAERAGNGEYTGTIEIGTVETGEATEAATVTNTGTRQHAVINFKIPRGKQGEKGEKGESGIGVMSAGMFALEVDEETGNLYAVYPEEMQGNNFEYEPTTGNLYFNVQ